MNNSKYSIIKLGGSNIKSRDELINYLNNIQMNYTKFILIISAFKDTSRKLHQAINFIDKQQYEESQILLNSVISFHLTFIESQEIIKIGKVLKEILEKVKIIGEFTNKIYDRFLAYGEILASQVVREMSTELNLNLSYLPALENIETDNSYNNANISEEITLKNIQKNINENTNYISEGFIGNYNGNPTLLGFENSNLTPLLFAKAIGIDLVTYLFDEKGIFIIDPKVSENNLLIDSINYEKALLASKNGMKLFTQKQINFASKNNIELNYKNLFNQSNSLINQSQESNILLIINSKNLVAVGDIKNYLSEIANNFDKVSINYNQNISYLELSHSDTKFNILDIANFIIDKIKKADKNRL